MNKILEIKNIHMTFSHSFTGVSGKEEMEHSSILNGIDLSFSKGKATALLGTNGSGKSTLFNIISGLLIPTSGSVYYTYNKVQKNLCNLAPYKHARYGISRLFQGSNIFPNLTVLENMKVADNNVWGEQPWQIFRQIQKTEHQREYEAAKILNTLLGEDNPLWEQRNQPAGNLSIGQQRLLAFARLFMNKNAQLYLLDEPSAGVNPLIREIMIRMIDNLKNEGKTIILIEHNLDFVKATCDESCYLEDGKLKYIGSINDTLNHQDLLTNYIGVK